MIQDPMLFLAAFVAVASLVVLVGAFVGNRAGAVESRLDRGGAAELPEGDLFAERRPFKLAALLLPTNEDGRQAIGDRLIQAGLYKRNSLPVFLLIKGVMIVLPVAFGFLAAGSGMVTMKEGLIVGALVGLAGTIVPGFCLDAQRKGRQTNLRRALPDALDVIIVCLEGGLSMPASFRKVANELNDAHPMLAAEMAIVEREVQMGRSTGEALKNFANRFDLEELRGLASVVLQAERFGASVVNALRVHAETLRERRHQQAEVKAAEAAVKLLFPTVFLIFPALFVVILGPAVFDIMELFARLNG